MVSHTLNDIEVEIFVEMDSNKYMLNEKLVSKDKKQVIFVILEIDKSFL